MQTERKSGGLGDLKYPLVSDVTKSISKSFGVLIPDQVLLMFVFDHLLVSYELLISPGYFAFIMPFLVCCEVL